MHRVGVVAVAIVAFAGVAGSAASAPGRTGLVHFLDNAPQITRVKGRLATAYDEKGRRLFQAGDAYIRAYAENPTGRVFVWDPLFQRVRVSPEGAPEVWLSCNELRPMPIACGPQIRQQDQSIYVGSGPLPTPPPRPAPPPPPPPPPPPAPSPAAGADDSAGFGAEVVEAPVVVVVGDPGGSRPGLGRGVPICPGDSRCRKVKRP
jgi:hypothetical protein